VSTPTGPDEPPRDPFAPPPPPPPGQQAWEQESSTQPGSPYGASGYPAPPAPGYGAPGFGASGYGAQPRNGMGTAALVCGVVALLLGLAGLFVLTALAAVPLGITAIVLAVIGRRRGLHGEATNGGTALVGGVLGLVGLLAAIAWLGLIGVFFARTADCAGLPTSAEQQQCVEDRLLNR
jgi:hypothetical protein